jgi:SAM-dependent methyltransferase
MTEATKDERMTDDAPRICDYEGSTYRTDFWEGRGRNYEDLVERQVLRQLLPTHGKRLLELGAGFGRLTTEYRAYDHVVLLDYSFSQLQYARDQLGDKGYTYVAADAYHLPFRRGVFDGATMIRVIHHFENVPQVLGAVRRVLADDALFILEYANKRNLKAVLRHRLGQQAWNPFDLTPVEFVELNFNFHPQYIQEQLHAAHFDTERQIPVSFLRLGLLKRLLPARALVQIDRLLQRTDALITPSVFTQNRTTGDSANQVDIADHAIFACPLTSDELVREGDLLINAEGLRWQIRDGIYDFKTVVE